MSSIGLEERHYSENLAISLEIVFCEWDMKDKLKAIIHDNAAGISLGVTLLKVEENISCAAHTLQLCVNEILYMDHVKTVVKNGLAIVNFFESSIVAKHELSRR